MFPCAPFLFHFPFSSTDCSFQLNCRATHNLAIRGYHTLAAASDDTGLLSRLLALGVEFNLHPSVLHILTERLQTVVLERIGQ